MKRFYSVVFLFVVICFSGFSQNCFINGSVHYDNNQQSLIHDSTLILLSQGNTVIYTDTVGSDGVYFFDNVAPGTYTLSAHCYKKWGGLNAADALAIARTFVGIPPFLTGLRLTVSLFTMSGQPSASDALFLLKRYVGMVQTFMPPNVPPPGKPDFASEIFTITLNPGDYLYQDILILCTGDADGSYLPY